MAKTVAFVLDQDFVDGLSKLSRESSVWYHYSDASFEALRTAHKAAHFVSPPMGWKRETTLANIHQIGKFIGSAVAANLDARLFQIFGKSVGIEYDPIMKSYGFRFSRKTLSMREYRKE